VLTDATKSTGGGVDSHSVFEKTAEVKHFTSS
jgi:hypothetical protein